MDFSEGETVRCRRVIEVYGDIYYVKVTLYKRVWVFWVPVTHLDKGVSRAQGIKNAREVSWKLRGQLLDWAESKV